MIGGWCNGPAGRTGHDSLTKTGHHDTLIVMMTATTTMLIEAWYYTIVRLSAISLLTVK